MIGLAKKSTKRVQNSPLAIIVSLKAAIKITTGIWHRNNIYDFASCHLRNMRFEWFQVS